jgi:isoprenylcysteine carboxyl methyltransferase (ICMT) family protein YpbQ
MQQKMYGVQGDSMAQRVVLAVCGLLWLMLAWWLLEAGGLGRAGHWLGEHWQAGDTVRRLVLVLCLTVYSLRLLLTQFVLLKRGVSWSEVFTVAPWLLILFLLLSWTGGRNESAAGPEVAMGVAMFAFGSWMNTHAEWARNKWKQKAENRGHLYTGSWFRWTRHPNYLGDLILFSGLCLIAGSWVTVVIPVLMLSGFVFVNVPALDAHLLEHYGLEFEEYAARTKKLIPFVY